MEVDPDDLSMDYLMSLAYKCNGDRGIQGPFLRTLFLVFFKELELTGHSRVALPAISLFAKMRQILSFY